MSCSEDEDDYMSDAFLMKAAQEDIRPGHIKNSTASRQNEIVAKKIRIDAEHRIQQKPLRELERERRAEGMNTAISSDNKGFAMLAKFGYKHGDSIGRSTKGIVEPIVLNVKTDRGGLGKEAALKELQEQQELLRQKRSKAREANRSQITTDEFRLRMAQKTSEKQMEADLGKCQRACEKLDMDESVECPAMKWFWPIRNNEHSQVEDPYDEVEKVIAENNSEESESEVDSENDEQSGEDIGLGSGKSSDGDADGTPKNKTTESDNVTNEIKNVIVPKANDAKKIQAEKDEEEIEYETVEKLEMLTRYLRTSYCYCHWCGVHYKDVADMQDSCPGPTKDDH